MFEEDEADETGVMVAFVEDEDEHVEVASDDLALDKRLGLTSGKPIVELSFKVVETRLARPGDIFSFTFNKTPN